MKSPRLLDAGTPEARSSLVKTKVTAERFSNLLFKTGRQQVLVRKGKGPTWASASTYPAFLASQGETAAGKGGRIDTNTDTNTITNTNTNIDTNTNTNGQ